MGFHVLIFKGWVGGVLTVVRRSVGVGCWPAMDLTVKGLHGGSFLMDFLESRKACRVPGVEQAGNKFIRPGIYLLRRGANKRADQALLAATEIIGWAVLSMSWLR